MGFVVTELENEKMDNIINFISNNTNILVVMFSIAFVTAAIANYIHVKYFKKK